MEIKNHMSELDSSIKESLEYVSESYRRYDPGNYLYRTLLRQRGKVDSFSDEYLELIYVTLSAWGMQSRGARLSDFSTFKSSLRSHASNIKILSGLKIQDISSEKVEEILQDTKELFDDLQLVASGKPKLVAFSKTLHFLLPDLVVPMDRKYTMRFFFDSHSIERDYEKQFSQYASVYREFYGFATSHPELSSYIDSNWNLNIPKILDNIVIGYMRNRSPRIRAN